MEKTLVNKKDYILNFFKALFSSLCMSLILILIFAFILKFVSVNDSTIKVINQIIKIISILYGVIVLRKKDKHSLFFKGLLIGLFYGVFAFLIFSMLSGNFIVDITTLNDIVFNSAIGAIIGLFLGFLTKRTIQ